MPDGESRSGIGGGTEPGISTAVIPAQAGIHNHDRHQKARQPPRLVLHRQR